MKKVLAIIITIILALVAGFAGGYYYAKNGDGDNSPVTIEDEIYEISELATLEWDYTEIGEFRGDAKKILNFDIPFTKKAMKIQYSGKVKMGPELKDNLQVDLDEVAKTVTVTIPHSVILSHEIDEESMQILYVKNGIFNSVTPENTNKLREDTKKKKEKSILKSEYPSQADEYAVKQITTYLNSVYPDLKVEVIVK